MSAPAQPQYPRRAAWLAEQLQLAGHLTPNRLEDFGGPDGKTTKRILQGFDVRDDVLQKVVTALNAAGRSVTFDDIPRD